MDGAGTLRAVARGLFDAAVRAADPALALRRALAQAPFPAPAPGGRWLVIAAGKAAVPMLRAALPLLPGAEAIAVTNDENHAEIPGAAVYGAGHPVPDARGEQAARAVMRALAAARAGDQVIALISGGASALMPAPVDGVSLADKIAVSRLLLSHGLGITEMNLVRQNLSRLKGGGFLRLAAPAQVSAYIMSDVIGDDLRVIASGPTVGPIGGPAEARAVLQAAGVWPALPPAARAALSRDPPGQAVPPVAQNHLVGSNRQSLEAMRDAAVAAGWQARIVDDALTGDVGAAAERILASARQAPAGLPQCLIFGGETTVTLRGTGLGGRNQELALRVALGAQGLGREWVFLSGGTDGRDGPTRAAGGLVDPGSPGRMAAAGLDAGALLADNDSNRALAASGDLLVTGATGTNVADVQVLLLA
ncbi:MAG: glycerate kinase type-2 family protein [Paracoccaceae bacterium]